MENQLLSSLQESQLQVRYKVEKENQKIPIAWG